MPRSTFSQRRSQAVYRRGAGTGISRNIRRIIWSHVLMPEVRAAAVRRQNRFIYRTARRSRAARAA